MAWRLNRISVQFGENSVFVEDGLAGRTVELQVDPKSGVLTASGEAGWTARLELAPVVATASATIISKDELRLHYETDAASISWLMQADTEAEVLSFREELGVLGVTI